MGALGAFFFALFTEMYGFPFTIYLLSSWLGKQYPALDPFTHANGHLLKVFLGDSRIAALIIHPGSNILLLIALVMIAVAWKKIYAGQGELVTDGIYRYIRHPQYAGFSLIIISLLIQWPTLITLVMGPLLMWVYQDFCHCFYTHERMDYPHQPAPGVLHSGRALVIGDAAGLAVLLPVKVIDRLKRCRIPDSRRHCGLNY